jgi:hypothetical protein
MIVGSGNIAKCLTDRHGAIFFASGVSNSRCEDPKLFQRERDKLYLFGPMKCLFYFSSIGVNFETSAYFNHKKDMEEMVRCFFPQHVILRIGNLIGDTNPNTFINYINSRKAQGLSCDIKDEYRYMIDPVMLNTLCQTLPLDQKIELTVATRIAKVRELI